MKTIPAALQTHLDSRSTTLAAMWIVTATNGTVKRFTDHDIDITYSGDVYSSVSGYVPSNIRSTDTTSVDNLDIKGLLSSIGITRDDLQGGVYDNAAVRLFSINYESPSDGEIKHKIGNLGEVKTADDFVAEFRSLSQALQQVIGSQYSPDCRYDLGDGLCLVNLPGQVAPSAHEYWRIYESANGVCKIREIEMALVAAGADQCTGGTATASSDNGFDVAANAFDDTSNSWESAGSTGPHWIEYQFTSAQTILEIRLVAGSTPSQMPSTFDIQYSDNGSDWTTTITYSGNSWSTNGESQSFLAQLPEETDYTRSGTLTAATDNANFADSSLTDGDGYFNYGVITFTSGNNNGLSKEIKNHISAGGVIELFEPMPFTVQIGDDYDIVAGCDKLLSTCKTRFDNVVNFGGEPHVPGLNTVNRFGGQ